MKTHVILLCHDHVARLAYGKRLIEIDETSFGAGLISCKNNPVQQGVEIKPASLGWGVPCGYHGTLVFLALRVLQVGHGAIQPIWDHPYTPATPPHVCISRVPVAHVLDGQLVVTVVKDVPCLLNICVLGKVIFTPNLMTILEFLV
jgi:hypothetical protein